jgi:hypothetical protein
MVRARGVSMTPVDHDVGNVDAPRAELLRHRLRERTQPELPYRKRRKVSAAANRCHRSGEQDRTASPFEHAR